MMKIQIYEVKILKTIKKLNNKKKELLKKFDSKCNEAVMSFKVSTLGQKFGKILTSVAIFMMTFGVNAYAATGTNAIDSLITWVAGWTLKIGLIVAFFGGVQTALGFKNDDADGKVRGLKTLAAGFMVAGISGSLDLFGL